MKLTTHWKEKMLFETTDGQVTAAMDAKPPIGTGTALSPKQMALAAVVGCTAMDVVALMRKFRQDLQAFSIEAEAPLTEGGHPVVFTKVLLDFYFEGPVEQEKAIEAVTLSQTKYCGVSAMMAKACPIHYKIYLNKNLVHEADSKF